MTIRFSSKTNDSALNTQIEEIFFEIRNGCVSAAILAACIHANYNDYFPNVNQLKLMIIRLLNPEEDTKRIAGLSTAYPKLNDLSFSNKRKNIKPLIELLKRNPNEYKITDNGKKALEKTIEELRRIANILEGLSKE